MNENNEKREIDTSMIIMGDIKQLLILLQRSRRKIICKDIKNTENKQVNPCIHKEIVHIYIQHSETFIKTAQVTVHEDVSKKF